MRTFDVRRLGRAAPVLTWFAATLVAACAPAARPGMTRGDPASAEPAAEAAARTGSSLPALAVTQVADGSRRIQQFEAVDQDLRLVLRTLAETFGLSYQIEADVEGPVTARLDGVTLEEALATILPPQFSYTLQGNVLRVTGGRLQTRIYSMDYVALNRISSTSTVVQRTLGASGQQIGSSLGGALGGGLPGTTGGSTGSAIGGGGGDVIVTTSITDLWEDVRIAIEALTFDSAGVTAQGQQNVSGGANQSRSFSRVGSDGRRVIINPTAGQITVTAPAANHAQIETFLRAFENSIQRQVIIEAKIVEVQLRREFRFGVDWSVLGSRFALQFRNADPTTSNNITLSIGGGNSQITAVLRALESQGDVSVLSSPRINAMNNQRASFDATTAEVFYAVTRQPVFSPSGAVISFNTQILPQQIAVGVVLDVIAQIGADNVITMNVRPLVSNVARIEEIVLEDGTQARTPVVDRRQTDTMARVRAGETIVIGGLMQNRRERRTTGIPGLRDIPLIGRIFTGVANDDERNELVVFLTPTVVIGQPATR